MPFALELALDPSTLAILFAVAFTAGFIDAIAGGGGLITIPALLSAGLPPAAALATNKLQGSFGTAMSTYTFWRAGQIEIRPMLFPVACVFVGAGAGTFAVQYVGAGFLMALIPILLVAIALYFLLSPRAGDVEAQARLSLKAFSLTVGIGVGFYDGFFGPGTGSFFALGCVALLENPIDSQSDDYLGNGNRLLLDARLNAAGDDPRHGSERRDQDHDRRRGDCFRDAEARKELHRNAP